MRGQGWDGGVLHTHNPVSLLDDTCRIEPVVRRPAPLREVAAGVEIVRSKSYYPDLLAWCREVVWWGNKKGAYLYLNRNISPQPQLAGHF